MHSNYCDNLYKIIPDNIEDINAEISNKTILEEYLFELVEKNPLISYEKFAEEAFQKYNQLGCNYNIFPTTWNNLYKKIRNNSGKFNVDYVLRNYLTIDKFMFFRKANYSINPLKSNNTISKYLLCASDYHINKMRLSNAFLVDGTFIRPYGYYQTIIIMYLEKYTKKFIPGVYILASNKTEFIYNDSIKSFKNILTYDNEKEKI